MFFDIININVILEETFYLFILYALGLVGWLIGDKLKLPAAPVLGGILLVGSLRILDVGLPFLHDYFILVLQILLGVMIGARIDREAMNSLNKLALPAGLMSIWALAITLLFGVIIALISPLEITTGILSSSIGGLPEMIVLAHETVADPLIVAMFQIVRIFVTALLFPFALKALINNKIQEKNNEKNKAENEPDNSSRNTTKESSSFDNSSKISESNSESESINEPERSLKQWFSKASKLIFTLCASGIVGWLFIYLGVPAGGLVGSMLFIMVAQNSRLSVEVPPAHTFNWFLVGIGLMVTNQVQPETLQLIFSWELFLPLVVSLVLTYTSSAAMAYLLYKLTGWSLVICLMSSAPGGIAFFTGLAIEYGYDPVYVSMLHLARVITLKLTIPFLFMLFY